MRSHARSLLDTLLGTAFFLGGFWYLHLRVKAETLGWYDFAIFGACLVLGLSIGYRDRIPVITSGARTVIKARFSGSHIPPSE